MANKFDICVVGSGAGGAPLAWSLAKKGLKVALLDRGSDFETDGIAKDEISLCRTSPFIPQGDLGLREVVYGGSSTIYKSQLWTGATVGGGTRIMSSFFLRMKEEDFRTHSTFGAVKGATHQDWPITLADLAHYYDQVEEQIGISPSKLCDLPPLKGHEAGEFLTHQCDQLGVKTDITPRAILSQEWRGRGACSYSGLCGSYPCLTGAKGSTKVAFIVDALTTGNLTLLPNHYVYKINSNSDAITSVDCINKTGYEKINAETYVLALSAIESARLLLNSHNSHFNNGLANSSGEVGKNLTFTTPCEVTGFFRKELFSSITESQSPFIQRYTNYFYRLNYDVLQYKRGGSVIFLFPHPNPINRALQLSYNTDGSRVIGKPLKEKLRNYYQYHHITTDTFIDYLPSPLTKVTLSQKRDSFGFPVAKVFYQPHEESLKAAQIMGHNLSMLFETIGAEKTIFTNNPYTAGELQHGTCRFGEDKKRFVLNENCRSFDLKNLYITDGGFMPSGISVPSTFTIMANSLRVADSIYQG